MEFPRLGECPVKCIARSDALSCWHRFSEDQSLMQTEATKKLFTVDEYYRMAEAGILTEENRTELISGEILEMSAMGARHRAAVNRASHFLIPLFGEKAQVSIQLPVRLDEFNEPQPDICFLSPRRDFYESTHPGPSDVFMILEISDTSLHYDRDVKLEVYAGARIREVWIEDLVSQSLMIFRDPSTKMYKTSLTFCRGDVVSLLAFPEIAVQVSELLGG
jgi:Uma2 family endonuclease